MNRLTMTRAALACMTLWLGACATAQTTPQRPATPPPAASAAAGSTELFVPVQRLIGDARCTSDAQCRTVGVGHKPCGGPGGYLAWSTLATPDEAALNQAVERHATAQREEQRRSGRQSNCIAARDPGARCAAVPEGGAKRCGLNGSPGVGAP